MKQRKLESFPLCGSTFLSASPKSARLARFSTAFSTKPPAASTLGQIPKLRALASKGFDRLILPVAHGRQLLSPLKTTVSPCFGSLDSFFQRVDVLRNEKHAMTSPNGPSWSRSLPLDIWKYRKLKEGLSVLSCSTLMLT